MAKTINPKFDFRGPDPQELDRNEYPLGRIDHSPIRESHNSLAPNKFDEYERVIVNIVDAIGDYGISDTIAGSSDNLGAGIRKLFWIKFDKAGGNIEGATTFTETAPTIFNSDLSINANVNILGSYESTNRDIITVGTITARSANLEWGSGRLYRTGDIVVYSKKIYRCKVQHTSSSDFISDYAMHWDLAGGGGSTTLDVNASHNFNVGDVIRYESGYTKAQANDSYHLGMLIVSFVHDSNNFTAISAGYTDTLENVKDDEGNDLDPNTWYYLSETVAGGITKTEPQVSQAVLYTMDVGTGGKVKEGFVTLSYIPSVGAAAHIDSFDVKSAGLNHFTLEYSPIGKNWLIVSVDGDIINKSSFGLIDNEVTLSGALVSGQTVQFQYLSNVRATPAATMFKHTYTANIEGQTEFDMSSFLTYEPIGKAYMDVYIGPLIQDNEAYDVNGMILTIADPGVPIGTKVTVRVINSLNILVPSEETIKSNHLGKIDFYRGSRNINSSKTLLDGENYMSIGPVNIDENSVVDIGDDCSWVIL